MSDKICTWTQQDDPESGYYESSCGSSFMVNDDTPENNGFKFCCFCGGKLVQQLLEDNEGN